MREPHPQSHVTHWSRGHVANKKHYISTFTKSIDQNKQGGDLGWRELTHKVTWHFDIVVTWQFENVIFTQPQSLWLPNLAGCVLRLRRRLAQSQMRLLFRGHITKTSFSLLSSLSNGLWSVALPKDERTSFKNLQFTWHFHHLTNWKRYA